MIAFRAATNWPLDDIRKGEVVRKYSQPIGYASEDISAGSHVHTHNLEFRQVEQAYEFARTHSEPLIGGSDRVIPWIQAPRRKGSEPGTTLQ